MENKIIKLELAYYHERIVSNLETYLADDNASYEYLEGAVKAYREIIVYASNNVNTSDCFEIFVLTLDIAYNNMDMDIIDYIKQLDKTDEEIEKLVTLFEELCETNELAESIEARFSQGIIMY